MHSMAIIPEIDRNTCLWIYSPQFWYICSYIFTAPSPRLQQQFQVLIRGFTGVLNAVLRALVTSGTALRSTLDFVLLIDHK